MFMQELYNFSFNFILYFGNPGGLGDPAVRLLHSPSCIVHVSYIITLRVGGGVKQLVLSVRRRRLLSQKILKFHSNGRISGYDDL